MQDALNASPAVFPAGSEIAPLHSPAHPYCRSLQCPCHTDLEYHRRLTSLAMNPEDVDQADLVGLLASLTQADMIVEVLG